MNTFVACPSRIRVADLSTLTVLVDLRTGRVESLLGWTHHAWRALARGGDLQAAVDSGAASSARMAELVRVLVADGLLEIAPVPRPWAAVAPPTTQPSWGTHEVPASLAPTVRPSPGAAVLATGSLATVLLVRHAGRRAQSFARIIKLISTAHRPAARQANAAQVADALHWVRNVALILPFRVACLEETAAAMLVLALSGRRAGWCHGIAADPVRLHAWITVDGLPVDEPASTSRYAPLLRIPAACAEADKDTTR